MSSIQHSPILQTGGKLGKFIIVERILGLLTRTVDGLMLYYIVKDPEYGFYKAFIIGGLWNLILCSAIVGVNNYLQKQHQFDLTGLGDLRDWKHSEGLSGIKLLMLRMKNWILSRNLTIFWIGSWFMIDPDYVTILLQKQGESFTRVITTITLPSVVLAMAVWTPFYWALVRVSGFADSQFVQWVLFVLD